MYDLRHTGATLLPAAGVNVKVVGERLGHERVEITLEHYAHALPNMQRQAAEVVDELFGSKGSQKGPTSGKGGKATGKKSREN